MPRAKMLRSQWLGTACEQATALRQPALLSPLTSSWSRRGTAPARPWRSTSDLWRAGGRQVCFDYSAINISRPSIRTGQNRLGAVVQPQVEFRPLRTKAVVRSRRPRATLAASSRGHEQGRRLSKAGGYSNLLKSRTPLRPSLFARSGSSSLSKKVCTTYPNGSGHRGWQFPYVPFLGCEASPPKGCRVVPGLGSNRRELLSPPSSFARVGGLRRCTSRLQFCDARPYPEVPYSWPGRQAPRRRR